MSTTEDIEPNEVETTRRAATISPTLRTALQAAPSTAGRCCSAPRAHSQPSGSARPARAAGYATSVRALPGRRFDPVLARQLQAGASRRPAAIRARTSRERSCT